MELFRPMLPPRPGYVEIEVGGIRQYKRIDAAPEANERDVMLLELDFRLMLIENNLTDLEV